MFAALGVGLAIPYLLVAAMPGIATRLPHPGPWMIVLKRLLAFGLGGTALWLLTVLSLQTSASAAIAVGLLSLSIVVVLAFAKKSTKWRAAMTAAVALFAAGSFLAPSLLETGTGVPVKAAPEGLWQPFDLAAIPNLVATGKTVLVDVTAEWCLTCKVNEALVLNQPGIVALIRDRHVIAMRADWTRRDDAIEAYLQSFGRYGIPFNAVYGPGAPRGIVLPELLTGTAVR